MSSAGAIEIYDIAVDPDESSPLDPKPDEVRRASEKAERWWIGRQVAAPQEQPPDPEVIERLRKLGFVP